MIVAVVPNSPREKYTNFLIVALRRVRKRHAIKIDVEDTSIYEWYHPPESSDLLFAKLFNIPLSGRLSRHTKIDCDEDESGQDSLVEHLPRWSRNSCE